MVRRPVGIFYSAWWMGFLWLLLNSGMGGVCAEVWADEVNVQASVDRTRVRVGDTFTLTVSVQGEGQANTPELDLPNGFNVVGSTSSSSTSISIVNGQMSTARTTSFVFSLEPTQQGAFTLGPVRVVSNGKTYKSAPIRMEVVAGGGAPQRTRPAPGQNVSSEDLRQIEENLYILAETDKKQAYVGEQVTLTYTLYTRFNLQNVHYGKQPTFTGFWAETIFDAQRLDQRREIVDGRAFNAARLKEVALFPTSQGRQSLEQLEMVCDIPVQSRRRSVFDRDDFFSFDPFGQSRQVTVRSEDIGLDVLPLPPGAPSEFSGAVGQFQISASATPVQVRQGDPVSLKIAVSGTGNLGAVSQPVPASEDGFKLYDPKASVETETRNGRVGGRKLFEYVVIPQVAGKIEIPAFRLAYFDPNLKRYRTVETEAVSLVVTPGETEQVAAVPALSRQEVQVLGKDIRHIKPDLNVLEDQGGVLYRDWRFLLLQLMPILGFLGAFVFKRHRERLVGDVAYARRRRASSDARKRLSEARRMLKEDDDGFYVELNAALARFLADRLNVAAAGMTGESAARILGDKGVSAPIISEVTKVFQECDLARFAPGQVAAGARTELYKTAERLLGELEGRV